MDLSSADPLSACLHALTVNPAITGMLAAWPPPPGNETAPRVLGEARPPWPMLQVVAGTAGGTGLLRWTVTGEVLVSAWGPPDRSVGSAALRRLLYMALGVLAELPELPTPAGAPVVADVRLSVPAQPIEEADGQLRWLAGLMVVAHPPQPA